MLMRPRNDRKCLDLLHEHVARDAAEPVFIKLGNAFYSTAELAAYIRSRPQELDLGNPRDRPRIPCMPSQRLRTLPSGFNCFEATALYLTLAEVIDPGTPRTSCTVRIGNGYHTFPVERDQPVILDPDPPPRNALAAGLYECEKQNGRWPSLGHCDNTTNWLIRVAANAAKSSGEKLAVRNAVSSLNGALVHGEPLRDLPAIAQTIALAESEAELWGDDGLDALDRATRSLRNLQIRADLGGFAGLAKKLGVKALEAYVASQAGPVGIVLLNELRGPKPGEVAPKVPAPSAEPSTSPTTTTGDPLIPMSLH